MGCLHPHSCVKKAKSLLGTIPSKWNPAVNQPYDNQDPTRNPHVSSESNKGHVFNQKGSIITKLKDIFWAFTTGPRYDQVYIPIRTNTSRQQLEVFGAAARSGPLTIKAGIAFKERDNLNQGAEWHSPNKIEGGDNQLIPILMTSLKSGTTMNLVVNIRSRDTIRMLMDDLSKMEDTGFWETRNAGRLKTLIGKLRMHAATIKLKDITNSLVTSTKQTAQELMREEVNNRCPLVLPPIPTELHITGTKLLKTTQALAYKWLKKDFAPQARPRTHKMLENIKHIVKRAGGTAPSDAQIWKSLRNKNFSRQVRVFQWKSVHNAYKVSSY